MTMQSSMGEARNDEGQQDNRRGSGGREDEESPGHDHDGDEEDAGADEGLNHEDDYEVVHGGRARNEEGQEDNHRGSGVGGGEKTKNPQEMITTVMLYTVIM